VTAYPFGVCDRQYFYGFVRGELTAQLFRKEALAAQQAHSLGSIRIGRLPAYSKLAGIAFLLIAALITFAILAHMTRKTRLPGLLMPLRGTLNVTLSEAGLLTKVYVKEGDAVLQGQTVAIVSTDRSTEHGDLAALIGRSLEQRHENLKTERNLAQQQARERDQALAQRLHSIEVEQEQAEDELDLAQRRSKLAWKTVERYQQLMKDGFVSDIQAQQKQEEWLDLRARERTAQRTLTALRRDLQSTTAERAAVTSTLQTQLTQIDRSAAALDQEISENQARAKRFIVAPQNAIVSTVTAKVGQMLQSGQAIATLIPQDSDGSRSSELEAQLYAPSRAVGFVKPGQTVWVRYAAYPYQKFGMAPGEVSLVSDTPISPQDLPVGQAQALLQAAQSTEPLYRINVKLKSQQISAYGKQQFLKPGMALEADVQQDRRAIWEWLMEPLIAARKSKILSEGDG
jgi:membrane fusion protein